PDIEIGDDAAGGNRLVFRQYKAECFGDVDTGELQHQVAELATFHHNSEGAVAGAEDLGEAVALPRQIDMTAERASHVPGELRITEEFLVIQSADLQIGPDRGYGLAAVQDYAPTDRPSGNAETEGVAHTPSIVELQRGL